MAKWMNEIELLLTNALMGLDTIDKGINRIELLLTNESRELDYYW